MYRICNKIWRLTKKLFEHWLKHNQKLVRIKLNIWLWRLKNWDKKMHFCKKEFLKVNQQEKLINRLIKSFWLMSWLRKLQFKQQPFQIWISYFLNWLLLRLIWQKKTLFLKIESNKPFKDLDKHSNLQIKTNKANRKTLTSKINTK